MKQKITVGITDDKVDYMQVESWDYQARKPTSNTLGPNALGVKPDSKYKSFIDRRVVRIENGDIKVIRDNCSVMPEDFD